jgi:hypothetical protein
VYAPGGTISTSITYSYIDQPPILFIMVKKKTRNQRERGQTCVILDRSLKRQLKEEAARSDRDVSSIIGEASKRYLNEKREQERAERKEKTLQAS